MAKQPKLTVCRKCNGTMIKGTNICPHCGKKVKQPFYHRIGLVIFLLIIVLVVALSIGKDENIESTASQDDYSSMMEEMESMSQMLDEENSDDENSTDSEESDQDSDETIEESEESSEKSEVIEEESKEEISDTSTEEEKLIDGMHPDFKEAMDSYEAFYDEYCEFMTAYDAGTTDLKLIAKYGELMTEAIEMDAKFAAWEEEKLNDAELAYYLEVSGRISQKLIETANGMQ